MARFGVQPSDARALTNGTGLQSDYGRTAPSRIWSPVALIDPLPCTQGIFAAFFFFSLSPPSPPPPFFSPLFPPSLFPFLKKKFFLLAVQIFAARAEVEEDVFIFKSVTTGGLPSVITKERVDLTGMEALLGLGLSLL